MIDGERALFEAENGALTLTTHRIRVRSERRGSAYFGSIMLDQVASCEVARRSYPALLVIAAVAGLAAIFFGVSGVRDPGLGIGTGFVVAVACLLAYLATRRMTLAFASAGATLHVALAMPLSAAIEFIDAVEAARADYMKEVGHGR
jgi:multisubunit Na+/H+ antiporter MnhB subunit